MSPEVENVDSSGWIEEKEIEVHNSSEDRDDLKEFYIDKSHTPSEYEFSKLMTFDSKLDRLEVFVTALAVAILLGFTFLGQLGLLLGSIVGSLFGYRQIQDRKRISNHEF